MPTPADLQHLALTDGPEAARHALSQALAQGLPPDQDPVAWARLCELLGASLLAIQCWQEAQAREPSARLPLERLAELYAARGDEVRAAALRARLGVTGAQEPRPSGESRTWPPPTPITVPRCALPAPPAGVEP